MTPTRNRPARPGYTLVEILVVMSLIILLAALALGVSQTGMFGSQKVISGGDRASGWLLIAKQRAMRDGLPRGVRFFNSTAAPTAFTEAAYIELPDAWVPNPQQEGKPNGARIVFVYAWKSNPVPPGSPPGTLPLNSVFSQEVYFVGSTADLDEYDQRVSDKDFLVLPELGKSFQIKTANGPISPNTYMAPESSLPSPSATTLFTTTNSRQVVLLNSYPDLSAAGTGPSASPASPRSTPCVATMTTYKFGFQRPAQPLLGEPALQLTGGISIDFREPLAVAPFYTDSVNTPTAVPPYYPTTTFGVSTKPDAATGGRFFDVMFSPSGQVLDNNAGLICLWVRESSKTPHPRLNAAGECDDPITFDAAGPMVFVVVNARNGLISTQPINASAVKNPAPASNYDPYQFAKDGINSGL